MNGQFIRVPAGLIKRCKQHFHSLSMGVEIILGNNGYVWLHATDPVPSSTENSENVDSKRLLRVVILNFLSSLMYVMFTFRK